MARAQLKFQVKDRSGSVVQNASVTVYRKGTTTAPYGTMYNAETGGASITSPLVSNAQGEIEAWLNTPQLIDLLVEDNSNTCFYPSSPSSLLSFSPFTEGYQLLPGPSSNIADAATPSSFTIENNNEALHSFVVQSDSGDGLGLKQRFIIENSNPGPADLNFRNCAYNVGSTDGGISPLVTNNYFSPALSSGQYIRCFIPGSSTNTCFYVGTSGDIVLNVGGIASSAITVQTFGAANPRWLLSEFGVMSWGDGVAALDTDLYRNAANELKTDDSFIAAGNVQSNNFTNAGNSSAYLNLTADGAIVFARGDAADVPFTVRGMTAQSANLQNWQSVTPTTLAAVTATGAIDMLEQAEPAAPAANTGRLFVQDSGGKSQLAIRFPSGVSQVIATEP